jgi:hypothetical protein
MATQAALQASGSSPVLAKAQKLMNRRLLAIPTGAVS